MKKICIISDTHFSRDNMLLFSQIDAEKTFLSVINEVKKEKPDYLFLLGDISQDGSIESYKKIKLALETIDCNKYLLMGNHDSENIQSILSNNILMPDFLDIDNHRFIFISSYKGNCLDEGYVKTEEFIKITRLITSGKNIYVLVHHHFIQAGGIIDNWIMDNHKEFKLFIERHNITAVFHGHVHHPYIKKINNINVYAAPSTCVQFELQEKLILNPTIGYQTLALSENSFEHKTIII